MTLPDTPFVCKNIDWGAAIGKFRELGFGTKAIAYHHANAIDQAKVEAVIAAAFGEVIPAEVETYRECGVVVVPESSDTCPIVGSRYVAWQPVISDKE
jgi:hypothetical protein